MFGTCIWTICEVRRPHDLVARVLDVPRPEGLGHAAPGLARHHAPLRVVATALLAHHVAAARAVVTRPSDERGKVCTL